MEPSDGTFVKVRSILIDLITHLRTHLNSTPIPNPCQFTYTTVFEKEGLYESTAMKRNDGVSIFNLRGESNE